MLGPLDRHHLLQLGAQRGEVRHHEGAVAQHTLHSVGRLTAAPAIELKVTSKCHRPADTK